MNRGYFCVWRKIENSAVFQNEGLLKVFLWCLIRANHKESFVPIKVGRGFMEVKLIPGSFLFGRQSAAKALHMSPSTVWKRILKLKKLEILNIESNSHYSIIYIINWDSYQDGFKKRNSQGDSQGTAKEHRQSLKHLKNTTYSQNSLQILAYLNEKTGKKYRDASHIDARLKDGGTVDDCRKIIDNKLKDPFFIENPKHLNPITLFRKGHWDTYLNEAQEVKKSSW